MEKECMTESHDVEERYRSLANRLYQRLLVGS